MAVKYIDPFIDATVNVLKELFGLDAEVQKPYLVRAEDTHNWDVSAIIGIAGEAKGAVVLSFTEGLAKALTARLVGKDTAVTPDMVTDAIGEMVNIVAGNAKKGLEQYRLVISLPSIVKGKNHVIAWPARGIPVIGVPFKTTLEPCHLSVGLENIITYE
jgi:chemotaxis protein CheX